MRSRSLPASLSCFVFALLMLGLLSFQIGCLLNKWNLLLCMLLLQLLSLLFVYIYICVTVAMLIVAYVKLMRVRDARGMRNNNNNNHRHIDVICILSGMAYIYIVSYLIYIVIGVRHGRTVAVHQWLGCCVLAWVERIMI